MATISATESITLDGVVQAPGRPDEDTRGGFRHGGWGSPYSDKVAMDFVGEEMSKPGAMLFGRRTYDDVLDYWSTTTEPNPFSELLINVPKFVVSHAADTVLSFPNSTLLPGDATETVPRVSADVDGNLSIIGSGELVRSLQAAGLIDEYILQIHPLILGSGTKLFSAGNRAELTLGRSVTTSTGVFIGKYSTR
ncbi:dihydrofolate reductase family protein [Parafrigoribacterium mesophilum]|uniref:dihydrofolate reductase family protein n=1 Tax=Parafrigoribacterium mesophilum TaxID=433646 RepID=UPI0031FC47FD